MLGELYGTWSNVGLREISHRISIGLEEEKDPLAIRDPSSAEAHAHASTQWFSIQEPLRKWFGNQEMADRRRRKRALLPR
jgi:hypothetical protein